MNISGGKTKRVALGLQNQKFQPCTGKWHENKTLTVPLLAGNDTKKPKRKRSHFQKCPKPVLWLWDLFLSPKLT